MALFGGSRDISLFNTISKELINDIIQTEFPDLRRTVLRESCPAIQGTGTVDIVAESEGEMILSAEMSAPGTIVIGDNYDHRWVA